MPWHREGKKKPSNEKHALEEWGGDKARAHPPSTAKSVASDECKMNGKSADGKLPWKLARDAKRQQACMPSGESGKGASKEELVRHSCPPQPIALFVVP